MGWGMLRGMICNSGAGPFRLDGARAENDERGNMGGVGPAVGVGGHGPGTWFEMDPVSWRFLRWLGHVGSVGWAELAAGTDRR